VFVCVTCFSSRRYAVAYSSELKDGPLCVIGLTLTFNRGRLFLELSVHPFRAGFRKDALVRALCPGALRAGLLRAAWRTALCAWRWRKAGGVLPHTSFVFSKRKLQKLCVGRWGPVSL